MTESSDKSQLRVYYTRKEDLEIIKYICKNKLYDRVKGSKAWKQMSNEMCRENHNRSWQSLKERYRKFIILNLSDYNLNPEIVSNLLKPFGWEEQITEPKEKEPKKRKVYTTEEDKVIINHVLKHTGNVKGNSFWMKLEEMKIISGRSWPSMRNRFLKIIMKNLNEIVDPDTSEEVRRRANGDLSFVVYDELESKQQRNLSIAKKRKSQLSGRSSSPVHCSPQQKGLVAPPSLEPVASESDTCSSSFSSDSPILRKKSWEKKLFVESSDTEDELANPEGSRVYPNNTATRHKHSSADSTVRKPSAGCALPTKLPIIMLERCKAKISKGGVTTSPIKGITQTCSQGSDFHVVAATAVLRPDKRAATPATPADSSAGIASLTRRSPEWLDKSTLNSHVIGCTPQNASRSGVGARMKTVPEDREVEPMIICTEHLSSSSEDDEDQTYIDPIYVEYVDKKGPYLVPDGYKLSLGPLPFPVVHTLCIDLPS